MNVTILHNAVADSDSAADRDVLLQVAAVEQALAALGHPSRRLACTLNLELVEEALTQHRPDVVFNLVESLAGTDRLAHLAAVLLDDLDLHYTGTPAAALHFANNKPRAKARLRAANLPTPDWTLVDGKPAVQLPPPYIIKAMWEHASVGLDDHAVVADGDGSTVREQIASRSRQLGHACFAEQFIVGREFNLSLIAAPDGCRVLPPAEIEFSDFPKSKPRIVGYAAKWHDESAEYRGTPRIFDFLLSDAPLLDRLRSLAGECWKLFGLAGYARVDFRVDVSGEPWILEVNANPCLSPDAGFVAALELDKVSMATAVDWILTDALRPKAAVSERIVPSTQYSVPSTEYPTPGPPVADRRKSTNKNKRRSPLTALRTEPRPDDCDSVRHIVAATKLFRPAEIDVAVELVQARLEKGPASGYDFVFAEQKGTVVGYICFGKNTLTVSSFDIYWIAVEPSKQGQGLGQRLLAEAERYIAAAGGMRIYIETSHRADYQATRGFYERSGYQLAAILDDFYAPGDSKATYVKTITSNSATSN